MAQAQEKAPLNVLTNGWLEEPEVCLMVRGRGVTPLTIPCSRMNNWSKESKVYPMVQDREGVLPNAL